MVLVGRQEGTTNRNYGSTNKKKTTTQSIETQQSVHLGLQYTQGGCVAISCLQ